MLLKISIFEYLHAYDISSHSLQSTSLMAEKGQNLEEYHMFVHYCVCVCVYIYIYIHTHTYIYMCVCDRDYKTQFQMFNILRYLILF